MTAKIDGWEIIEDGHEEVVSVYPPKGWMPGGYIPREFSQTLAQVLCRARGFRVYWECKEA